MTAPTTFAGQQAAILRTLVKQAEGYTPATLEAITAPRDDISAEIVFITPAVALDILAKHHAPNRALSIASKDAYLADMIRGRWELNGETIAFDTTGKLIQGQHRIAALAETARKLIGFPGLPFVAVFGLPRKAHKRHKGHNRGDDDHGHDRGDRRRVAFGRQLIVSFREDVAHRQPDGSFNPLARRRMEHQLDLRPPSRRAAR